MPEISWYAKLKDEPTFMPGSSYYAGTCYPDHPINVQVQLWNNRWGTEDVDSLENFRIAVYFRDVEDVSLLSRLSFVHDGSELVPVIDEDLGLVELQFPEGTSISGAANNGSSTDASNADNFLAFEVTFSPDENKTVKENDLKNLYFEIVQD